MLLQDTANIIKDIAELSDIFYKMEDDIITLFCQKNELKYAFKISYRLMLNDISWNGSYIHQMAYDIAHQFQQAENKEKEKEYLEYIQENDFKEKPDAYEFIDIGKRMLELD